MRSDTPASASIAIHTQPKMIVLPKSGWRISSTATAPVINADSANTGSDLSLSRKRQQPRHRDHEERLQEFRRLQLADADVDPALGAVHFGPEHGDEDQHDEEERRAGERQAPRALAGQHRNADHHRQSERDPGDLAVEIMEVREAHRAARITVRRGRRSGGDGDQADADQHADQQQQDAVDLPEPAARGRAVGAAVAVGVGECGLGLDAARDAADHNAPTKLRNASPRSSKSLNWSKLAHAGDSSTVSPGLGILCGGPHRRAKLATIFHGHVRFRAASRTTRPPRRWCRPSGHGRSAARIRRDCRSWPPAQNPADRRERRQRRSGRGRIGRLAVVDEHDAVLLADALHAVGEAGVGAEALLRFRRAQDRARDRPRSLPPHFAAL